MRLKRAFINILLPCIVLISFQSEAIHAQGYRNFEVAIYCTVFDVEQMSDRDYLEKAVSLLEKEMHIDKVYLETHRRDGGE